MDAAASTTPTPATLGRVLGLVRRMIDFGRGLAETLRNPQPNPGPDAAREFRHRCRLFGTTDVAAILLRIVRGLRRAAALEALLLARAQRGRDLEPVYLRDSTPRAPALALDPSAAPRPRARHEPLPLEPSDEQIAADIRRRPVGATIADIYLDLGLLPGELGRDTQKELMDTVMHYGGSLIRLLRFDEDMRRAREYLAILRSDAPLPPELQPFPWVQAAATGPP